MVVVVPTVPLLPAKVPEPVPPATEEHKILPLEGTLYPLGKGHMPAFSEDDAISVMEEATSSNSNNEIGG